jgi:hypothetical protein
MDEVFSAALIGGVLGTFFGGFSNFLWERWLPDWLTWRRSQRVDREQQLSSVRGPAYAALADLQGRLRAVARTQAANARYTESIGEADYYPNSTAFLIARVFAAQHVLRERMAMFDYAELYKKLEKLTSAFSDGGPGFQFFRLEQREIGERMHTVADPETSTFMSLSQFLDLMEQDDRPRWMHTMCGRVESLLDDPLGEVYRLQDVDEALTSLMVLIDSKGQWRVDDQQPPIDAASILAKAERGQARVCGLAGLIRGWLTSRQRSTRCSVACHDSGDQQGTDGRADQAAGADGEPVAGQQACQQPADEGPDEAHEQDAAPVVRAHPLVDHHVGDPTRGQTYDDDEEDQHAIEARFAGRAGHRSPRMSPATRARVQVC